MADEVNGGGQRAVLDLVESGRALHRAGALDEAERHYRQALAQDEECAEAHQLIAVIAGQRGHFADAIAGFRRTVAIDGPTPERLYNLAEAYRVSGDFKAALAAYNQTLALDAGFLDAYRSCAQMAHAAAAGAAEFDKAGASGLDKLAAHYLMGLGHAQLRMGETAAAEEAYRQALTLDSEKAEIYNALGMIAFERGRPIEAERLLLRAVALEPQAPLYLNNLGLALLHQVRISEAEEHFRRAIANDGSFEAARINLEEGALRAQHYRANLSPEAMLRAHLEWGFKAIARAKEAQPLRRLMNVPDPARRLKVAYVQPDFGSRLVTSCLEVVLAHHDLRGIESFVYSDRTMNDRKARRTLGLAQQRRPTLRRTAREVAHMMREDRIDVAVDLAGHSENNRLDVFALRPAPVTATWLGYPDTTGLDTIDYRISDAVVDPPESADELYTEKLYRLGSGFLVYRPAENTPHPFPLIAQRPGAVTFGSVTDIRKISPDVIVAWSVILATLPEARLNVFGRQLADPAMATRLREAFQQQGINPARVRLVPLPADAVEQFRAYAEIDVVLDTFPYCGEVYSCDALWMGVPVVTLRGDRHCARIGASLLTQLGLRRLIALTPNEYVGLAVALARDLDRLRTLRAELRPQMRASPLMDEAGFARRFEVALRGMWRRWCADQAAQTTG